MRKSLIVFGLALCCAVPPLVAADEPIARVPAITDPAADPIVKEMLDAIQARGAKPINLNLVMFNAPPLAKASSAAAFAIRFDLKTPRPYRELAIMRAVQNWEGSYEINQHNAMAKACGFSQAQLDGLANWRDGTLFDAKQRALLAYVDQLTNRPGKVDDATFAEFAKHFPMNEIVELTLTATTYMGTAAFTNAIELKIETDGRQTTIGKC